jgi:hypothetical protein
VLVLPRLPTASLSLLEEPGVPAGPKLLPVVPRLFALSAFSSGAPPVPSTVAQVLSVVPDPPDDMPPVEATGEELPEELPDAPPPEPPLLCANTGEHDRKPTRNTAVPNFMAVSNFV